MKSPTEPQLRARRGEACFLTTDRNGCGPSPYVEIEGVQFRACAFHEELIRSIVRDAKRRERKVA